ncbi:MAG: alkaline phosphatase family protein [Solirubrobacterales bacterium]
MRVYVVVLDGLRPTEVNPTLMPNLSALRAGGTWYEEARSVYIAETLPNHAAMMTGVVPARNGIVANDYWEPNPDSAQRFRMQDPALLEADTLTTRLENSCGMSTATVQSKGYLWRLFGGEPATPGDPNPQREADFHWDPQSSDFYIGAPDDHALDIATMNEGLLPWIRSNPPTPQFAFVNLGDIDRAGHIDEFAALTEGGLTGTRQAALKDTDEQLGSLIEELQSTGAWDETVLIFPSDHGFDWSRPDNVFFINTKLSDNGYGGRLSTPPIPNGGASMLYVRDPQDIAPIARILAAQPEVAFVSTREPVEGAAIHRHSEAGIDNANAGDVVVFLKPGWRVGDESGFAIPGNHGHPVTQHSTLLVTGGHPILRDAGSSVSGEAVYDPARRPFSPPAGGPGNLSIAPTVAGLLGIGEPAGGYDGSPLAAAFEDYAFLPHRACEAASPPPDLTVDVSDQPDPVRRNDVLTYVVPVENRGASDATGVTLQDLLADTVRLRAVRSTHGACTASGRTVNCALGVLSPGDRATVTIEVRAERPGTISNSASVQANEPELERANNEAAEVTTVLPRGAG